MASVFLNKPKLNHCYHPSALEPQHFSVYSTCKSIWHPVPVDLGGQPMAQRLLSSSTEVKPFLRPEFALYFLLHPIIPLKLPQHSILLQPNSYSELSVQSDFNYTLTLFQIRWIISSPFSEESKFEYNPVTKSNCPLFALLVSRSLCFDIMANPTSDTFTIDSCSSSLSPCTNHPP